MQVVNFGAWYPRYSVLQPHHAWPAWQADMKELINERLSLYKATTFWRSYAAAHYGGMNGTNTFEEVRLVVLARLLPVLAQHLGWRMCTIDPRVQQRQPVQQQIVCEISDIDRQACAAPCRLGHCFDHDLQGKGNLQPKKCVARSVYLVAHTAKAVKEAGVWPAAKHAELAKGRACQTSFP